MFGHRKTLSRAGFVASMAAMALIVTGCGDGRNNDAGQEPASIYTTEQATPSPSSSVSPSPVEVTASPTVVATSTSPAAAPVKEYKSSRVAANGGELTTTIAKITCVGEPVSGYWPERAKAVSNRSASPYGDIALGDNRAKTVQITHNTLAGEKFLPNIGCGYVRGGHNDWLHEFNLVAQPGGNALNVVCEHGVGCTVNGKQVALRRR